VPESSENTGKWVVTSVTSSSELPAVLTVAEAAEYLRISARTYYQRASAGALPCVHIGSRIVVPKAALDEYLQAGLQTDVQTELPPEYRRWRAKAHES